MLQNGKHGVQSASSRAGAQAAPSLAYIVSRFPRLTETFILREILELERRGRPVPIFPLLRAQQPLRHAEVEGLMPRVHYTPFLSPALLLANAVRLVRSPRAYLKTLYCVLKGTWGSLNLFSRTVALFPKSVYLAQLMQACGIRHVHAHFATHPALVAMIISEFTGITFSFTVHAHDLFVHTKMLAEKAQKARFIVAVSDYNRQYLLSLLPPTAEHKVKVIRCGVESDRYQCGPPRQLRGDRAGENGVLDRPSKAALTIACVASLQPYKGIEYLLKACVLLRREFRNFHCLIVGEGEERRRLERLIATLDLGPQVRLLGARPQHEVAALLSDADLFVLPSVVAADGQMEGIPTALMEAMAAGLPVVGTRLSGIPELVEDGVTGMLVPPRDPQALASAMAQICRRADLRQALGLRAGQKVAADYDLRKNVALLDSLFKEVLLSSAHANKRSPRAFVDCHEHEPSRQEIIKEVCRRASTYFPQRSESHCHIVAEPLLSGEERDSEIYQLTVTNGRRATRQWILKLHRPRTTEAGDSWSRALECARREYEVLSFLWQQPRGFSRQFRVPRPLDYIPAYAALVLEKCQGEILEHSLRWASLRRCGSWQAELCRRALSCGEWLALFHHATKRPGNLREIYRRIEREFHCDLEACRALGVDEKLVSGTAAWFAGRKHLLFTGEHEIVGHHGDFGPQNIFISKEGVSVIDFEGFREGIPCEDVGDFLGRVESMPRYHVSPRLLRKMKQSFLDGYFRHGNVNPEQVEVCTLTKVVKSIAHNPLLARRDGRGQWLRNRRLRSYSAWIGERVA